RCLCDSGVQRQAQGGIEDYPEQRPASRKSRTVGEQGIVCNHGAHSNQNGIILVPELLNVGPGLIACDPSSGWTSGTKRMIWGKVFGRRRYFAVKRHSSLQRDQGDAVADVFGEGVIEGSGFVFEQSRADLHAGLPQAGESSATDERIGVGYTSD